MRRVKNVSVIGMFFGFLFITLVLGGANFYVARKLYIGLGHIFPNINIKVFTGVAVFLAFLMIAGFMRSMFPLPVAVKSFLRAVSMYWMGIFIYLLLLFVLSDLVLLILRLSKMIPSPIPGNIRFYAMTAVVAVSVLMVGYGLYNANQIDKATYTVAFDQRKLDGEINMVLISDLHLGALKSEQRVMAAVDEINMMNPDIVCIAGDIFDNDYYAVRNPEKVAEKLKTIKSKYGVYACLGNHDAGKTVDKFMKFLEMSNIRLLSDESVVIDDRFNLLGRVDGMPIGGYGGLKRTETEQALKQIDNELPIIVMDHNPQSIEEYGNNVDLIVSGHTHKGQLFPANIITGLMYMVDYGHYQKNNEAPHVIVTSGLGTWGMPMRVGTDCEIVNIRIK